MGIHMIDFAATEYRVQQYQDDPATMCQSTPRLKAYPTLTEMNCLPIFNPPLVYNSDGTDNDTSKLKTDGQVMCSPGPNQKPTAQQVRQLEQYTSGRFSLPTYGVKKRSSFKNRDTERTCFAERQIVVISSDPSHTASSLCNSSNAAGPDFVSIAESLYCDMCTGQLWPLCSLTVTTACFDVDTKIMKVNNSTATSPGVHPRDEIMGVSVPPKEYRKVLNWM